MSTFKLKPEEYVRDISLIPTYIKDMSFSIHKATGKPLEECTAYVTKKLEEKMIDKPIHYVGKNEVGDRVEKKVRFTKYIDTIINHDLIFSPSLAIYQNPEKKKSLLSIYIAKALSSRRDAKKKKFKAEEEGDIEQANYYENLQQVRKILANSLSGAHGSKSTILSLPTIHSTVTSMCRAAASYGNSNNEKLIAGNRHYWNASIVSSNIASIVHHTDLQKLKMVMDKYNLVAPSKEDAMRCIHNSTKYYWVSNKYMSRIEKIVSNLNDLELSAFLYMGDLYHLAKINKEVLHALLSKLSYVSTEQVENPKQYLDQLDDLQIPFLSLLLGEMLNGKTVSKFDEFSDDIKNTIGATARNILEVEDYYADFFKMFFVSNVMPCSIAQIPTIVRHAVVTSDTDSTIFTVKDWLTWYDENNPTSKEAINIGHAISYIASASIEHILAQMCKNLGVRNDQLFVYGMKSEFYFPVFCITSRAKTYFAYQGAQEGRYLPSRKLELKGAILKSSAGSLEVSEGVEALIRKTLDSICNNEYIKLSDLLKEVAQLERKIMKNIEEGGISYYKTKEIKPASSYKKAPEQSPYVAHILWNEVFADKYGKVNDPPYRTLKVNIEATNNTIYKQWLSSIEDSEIRDKLIAFMKKYKKAKISTFEVPQEIAIIKGIPKEITVGVDKRKIVSNLVEPFMVILETFGYYTIDKNNLRLISDTY